MGEFMKLPVTVEAFQAIEIIRSPAGDWTGFPAWLKEIYDDGQMVIGTDGVTLLHGPSHEPPQKALRGDYIVREPNGTVCVYDEATFERDHYSTKQPADDAVEVAEEVA